MEEETDLAETCANCENIDCINLFCHSPDDDKTVGGELYVYNFCTEHKLEIDDLEKYVCSNGRLIQCGCYIMETLNDLFPNDYLVLVSNEVPRDMKASFYLALSGHYRQAILIQRCVFENFLYGLYFHTEKIKFSKSEIEKKSIKKNFESWVSGGFRKRDDYLRDIIRRGEYISDEENKEWDKLFDELSKFVHTIMKTPTGKTIKHKDIEIKSCFSKVEFNLDELAEWSYYFKKVFFLVLCKLFKIYPEIKKIMPGKEGLKNIKEFFRKYKNELNDPYLTDILKMRSR